MPHNMAAESVMGMFGTLHQKAPSARPTHLSCRIRSKTNKSLVWFNEQSDKKRIISYVKRRARKDRESLKQKEKKTDIEITERIENKKKVDDMKKQRKTQRDAEKPRKAMELELKKVEETGDIQLLQQFELTDTETQTTFQILQGNESLLDATVTFTKEEASYVGSIKRIRMRLGKPVGFIISARSLSLSDNDDDDEYEEDLYFNKILVACDFVMKQLSITI
jgi:hypothetical protein